MSKFKIGEKVVCINNKRRWFKLGGLKRNEIYTITGFNPYDDGLILKEIKSPKSGFNAYSANRFRKIDYAFADKILQTIQPIVKRVSRPKVSVSKRVELCNIHYTSSVN